MAISCNKSRPYGAPDVNPEIILKNFNSFWNYYNHNTYLLSDYIALDASEKVITKKEFIEQLESGNFIPVALHSKKDKYLQLYPVNNNIDESIVSTITNEAKRAGKLEAWEGKPLPHFSFTDLNGMHYDSAVSKGKILVLKCWFIHCGKCNEEIPDCNELVAAYKANSKVQFISLALDQADSLKQFLRSTRLDYAVIPNQNNYLLNELGVESFPTHLIVDENGIIQRVMFRFEDVEPALKKILAKNEGR